MTRDEIIGLAKQAGFLDLDSLSRKIHDGFYHGFPRDERIHICNDERIKRFTALVAEAAAAPERDPELVRDAERYRWLRSYNTAKHPAVTEAFFLGDENLDVEIDAAIAAEKGGA